MRIRNFKDRNVGVRFYVLIQVLMTMYGIAKCIPPAKVYSKYKVIRIVSPTEAHLYALRALIQEHANTEVELWTLPNRYRAAVDIRVSPKYFRNVSKLLRKHGMRHKTLISDLQSAIEKQTNKPTGKSSTSWFEKYHPLEEIVMRLQESTAKWNGLVRLVSLGKSYERREQYAVEIRSNPQVSKPLVFINCGIHAREWISPATCMYFIDQLTLHHAEDLMVNEIISKVDVVIMPVLNVDGYVYSWEKDRLWRKNRRPNQGSECVGTDLNRNWGVGWGKAGASSNPCSPTYRGKSAMSEKEVQNVANYLESQRNRLIAYLDVHSYGQLWMLPWGFTGQHVKDFDELMRVGKAAVTAIKLQGGANTNYTLGQAFDVIYTESGTTKDYVYGYLNVKYTFSMELRDTGKNGFILPNNLIEPTAKEAFEGVKAMILNIKLGSKSKRNLSSLSAFQFKY